MKELIPDCPLCGEPLSGKGEDWNCQKCNLYFFREKLYCPICYLQKVNTIIIGNLEESIICPNSECPSHAETRHICHKSDCQKYSTCDHYLLYCGFERESLIEHFVNIPNRCVFFIFSDRDVISRKRLLRLYEYQRFGSFVNFIERKDWNLWRGFDEISN